MKIIDPSYLRYIHDGLESGKINKENSTALPDGLVGMYEALFPAESSPKERERLLNFFGIWALMKKDVTTSLVAALLDDWIEEQVEDAIATYSKWFNSPEPGKYQLYHERFRVYILQKMTQKQLLSLNEKIINNGKNALKKHDKSETEVYALEHLSTHLYMHAMLKKEWGANLKELSYNKSYWNRQIEISKGFDWTKKMLNEMMLWSGKYDDEEVIECALNKVDLHYIEQNNAPRIVQLVADGDIETALKRIEAFGVNDKEGLQRKFILYMLCLMELTLLESKDKPFRKNAIEKLLKHLDENLSVDHSVLNWNDFFPSYLMFQMACEWAELGLDYVLVFRFANELESEWIIEKGPYNNLQFEILTKISLIIRCKEFFSNLSVAFAKQDMYSESIENVNNISEYASEKIINTIIKIHDEFSYLGNIEKAESVLLKALEFAERESYIKIEALCKISSKYVAQGKLKEGADIIQKAIEFSNSINSNSVEITKISVELVKHGNLEDAIQLILNFEDDFDKIEAFCLISKELVKWGKLNEASSLTNYIIDDYDKDNVNNSISVELAKQGKLDDAIFFNSRIVYDGTGDEALHAISLELAKQGKFEEAKSYIEDIKYIKDEAISNLSVELARIGNTEEALTAINHIYDFWKFNAIREIAYELSRQAKIEDALNLFNEIRYEFSNTRSEILRNLAYEAIKKGLFFQTSLVLFEATKLNNVIYDYDLERLGTYKKLELLDSISNQLVKLNRVEVALACVENIGIEYEVNKFEILKNISVNLACIGELENSLKCSDLISDEYIKVNTLFEIAIELAKQKKLKEAENVFVEYIKCARKIPNNYLKIGYLVDLASELFKVGYYEDADSVLDEALNCANDIIPDFYCGEADKSKAICEISYELYKQGKFIESKITIQKAIDFAYKINDTWKKSSALSSIASSFAVRGDFDKALLYASEIIIDKNEVLSEIAVEFVKYGAIESAIECISKIESDYDRDKAFVEISIELAKQGNFEEALSLKSKIHYWKDRDESIKGILLESAKKGNFAVSESLFLEIRSLRVLLSCCFEIGKIAYSHLGFEKAIEIKNSFSKEELKLWSMKGIIQSLTPVGISKELMKKAIFYVDKDFISLEYLLSIYALNLIFFNELEFDKNIRLKSVLNIQWAIDIKNQKETNIFNQSDELDVDSDEFNDEYESDDLYGNEDVDYNESNDEYDSFDIENDETDENEGDDEDGQDEYEE
jgi:tetratricopeptide (TPR) repeat protein